MTNVRWSVRAARLAPLVMGLLLAPGHRVTSCLGQPSPSSSIWTPVPVAMKATLSSGRPTVVLLTSKQSPESLRLKVSMSSLPAFRSLAASMPLSEISAEAYPDQCRGLTAADLPFAAIYRKGPNGLELGESRRGVRDAADLLGWLASIGLIPPSLTPPAVGPADPNLVQAAHDHGGVVPSSQHVPSPQAPPPLVPEKQPSQVYAPPPPVPQYAPPHPYYPPPYSAPIPAAAPTYVNLAPPTMVVQQQPQQIIVGPSPPPQVTVLQMGMSPPPQPPNAGNGPPPNNPPMNLMMPANGPPPSQPAYGPPPSQPAYGPPPSQPAYGPPPSQPAYGPPPGPQNAGAGPGVVVANGPGPIDRMLAGIGRNLVRRGYPRVPVAEAPAAYGPAPAAYGPPLGFLPMGQPVASVMPMAAYAPASPAAYQPAFAPAPQPAYQPAPSPPQPTGPVPSPQSGSTGHHRFSIFR